MSTTVLIIDDDPVQRRLAEAMVRRLGFQAQIAENGHDGLNLLRSGESVDVVLLDLVMPGGMDGLSVLAEMRKSGIDTPVIVQTSNGSIDAVVNAMRAGAVDFVVKPAGAERLQVSIKNALRVDQLEEEVRRMRRRASGALGFKDLASKSPDMERVIRLAERSAKSNIPVLIEGESGVGKEVLARAIQGSGDRRGKAFVTVNCGAIPENLVESTLFGHEKGAFTGATEKHVGKFVEASGGTLFLDEIGELPLDAQVKLLRALQEGEVDPVGGKRAVRVDIRLISATNRSLLDLVKQGKFREDLYYRLNVFPMTLPPLRARREDIPDLVRSFCARFAAEEGKRLRGITAEAMALLSRYPWPGNVRQLENALFRAVVLADGDELTVAEFPQIAAQVEGFDVRIPPLPTQAALPAGGLEPVREIVRVEVRDPHAMSLVVEDTGDMKTMEAVEAEVIRFALQFYRGRMSEVSRRLGIGRSTLYRKLKELGLDDEERSEDAA
ncbi:MULTISPECIES: sigma-54-dependent transcriptional regulator [Methylorubrum]|jgi:DNA-binding NtrC family response regulator|uniref:DNA-binding transcriptional regulator NtrC n=5 Tax=Methylorubrum extorquens TaxID=408 RepID=C5AUU2_METEA|nr:MULTISPECIES: sigma-54 dependent transcriptional regulator [Methylorubrum]KQP87854.1 Fis family transcriptional regulator [Methylobacterium sp. Leaf119]MDF9865023.1 DNA-binding NtrC family response regulator [Methylorubrum pseudosasae]MDH6638593.1 DNA-binding NtrC family response regulator [Methylobacterium sp. SuP10 SLI 274]MDH6667778.1 DNA-binding NtrC family response regulator [Methylorubrum zatmanii]ABY31144.1 sigma-54 factor interaction domain-containing protein [Methylorubrum extorque